MTEDPRPRIAAQWERFARAETPERSPLYSRICARVAEDPWTLGFLAAMPPPKWQPNVLLAAVRYLHGTPEDPDDFLALVREDAGAIAATMATHATQTNEPARCATLLPVLARLPQPLALLEVGASAGLCLLPDRYAYDYGGGRRIAPSDPVGEPPLLACRADAATPLPERNVEVAWRAGLDLDPVDLGDPDAVRWLEALVWPGQEHRLERLRAAVAVARADPPRVARGDLRRDLAELAAGAPRDATLVVFHTAVLAYVPDAGERAAFAETVARLGAVWVANEGPAVVPGLPRLDDRPSRSAFALCVDGEPVAWTDPHGDAISWR